MLEEGYAAVTSRRVAARRGSSRNSSTTTSAPWTIFSWRCSGAAPSQGLERQAEALASEQPLWALWELSRDPRGTALTMEFAALANHRKAIRHEIALYAERLPAPTIGGMGAAASLQRRPDTWPAVVVDGVDDEHLAVLGH